VSDLPALPGPVWGLVSRPSWREARVRAEVAALEAHPIWQGEGVPEGHGRRVVLAPGFRASPRSMSRLEPWLRRSGWDTRRAPVGRNDMAAPVVMATLEAWLEETAAEEGGPVPVIGHSRGGQQARVLAVRHPRDVSLLVTLGAPLRALYPQHVIIRAPVAALHVRARVRRVPTDHDGNARYDADRTAPFPAGVPFVTVFSRTDGFLDWRLCLDPAADPVELDCTHFGLTTSIPAFEAIADALRRLDG